MLAVIEIGNSNVKVALVEGDSVRRTWRLDSDRGRPAASYGAELEHILTGESGPVDGVALASVVEELEKTFALAARQAFRTDPTIISWASDLAISNLCEPPNSVGIDRLLNTSAAFALCGGPAITVDFGTATTLDAVTGAGEFVGGAIAPGLQTAQAALLAAAPRLPRVDLAVPRRAIGRTTVEALQSGLILGGSSMVDGMVDRMKAEIGSNAIVIATGGLASVIAPTCRTIDRVDPNLTLQGIRLAWERAQTER